jgi:membrane protease YdiL (CAAX protease family)
MQESSKQKDIMMHPVMVVCYSALLFLSSQLIGTLLVQPLAPYVRSQTVQLTCYSFAGLVVVILLLQFNRKRESFFKVAGLKKTRLKNFLLLIPTLASYLLVSIGLITIISKLISGFNSTQPQDIGLAKSLQGIDLVAAFVSLIIITPIFEETIFRGVLFRGLRRRLPFWISAALVSLLFAAAHAQWNVAIDTFVLSLALCFLVEKTDSIIPGIILHAIKNSLAFFFLFVIK